MTTIRNPYAAAGPRYAPNELVHRTPVIHVAAPSITGVPTISGTEQVGQTLTATAAPSKGSDPLTVTWQWYADDVAIGGATESTYLLTVAEQGTIIHVVQTVTNRKGVDTSQSADTGAIAAA